MTRPPFPSSSRVRTAARSPSRAIGLGVLGVLVSAAGACSSKSPNENSGTLQSPPATMGTTTTLTSMTWAGQTINVSNLNGEVSVTGDPSATTVTLVAMPFAVAEVSADATAAAADVASTIELDESTAGEIDIGCGQASQAHGGAGIAQTGCVLMVTVPEGTPVMGLPLTVHTAVGAVTVSNVYSTLDDMQRIEVTTGQGEARGQSIMGNVRIESDDGVAVGVFPSIQADADIEVSSGTGDATVSLPADFSAAMMTLYAPMGTITIDPGFTNGIMSTSMSAGMAGFGASSLVVVSTMGDVTLQPL